MTHHQLLNKINYPHQLRQLNRQEHIPWLRNYTDSFILSNVSKTGGHLASNLGCVELTIALHYVYNTPDDAFGLGCGTSVLSTQNINRSPRENG